MSKLETMTSRALRIDLGEIASLGLDDSRIVRIGGVPPKQSLIVLRTPRGVIAYWNVCEHVPIPLDSGMGELPRGRELVCLGHGARFDRESGLCTSGPCRGRWLEPVPVEIEDGHAYARIPASEARSEPQASEAGGPASPGRNR